MRSALVLATPPPPRPPSPPHPLTLEDSGYHRPSSSSYNPSLLIITAILAIVIIITAFIHFLLTFLSRSSSSSSSSPELIRRRSSPASASTSAAPPPPNRDPKSLPLFSLAAVPKSSPDCAVCLSAFGPRDELRLLPACHHAFHAPCIDTWLRSSPSCPLCRSTIALSPPPALHVAAAEDHRGFRTRFQIDIGNVSHRSMTPPEEEGSSFEDVVEEEILQQRRRMPDKEEAEIAGPLPPEVEVAEAAGEVGRGWLKEYVDRLASSAWSSFNSIRFSERWSHHFDGGGDGGAGVGGESELEESGLSTFYRWLTVTGV